MNSTLPDLPDDLPVDVNFWFFLGIYYGAYLAVALVWITCLFNLYRCKFSPVPASRLVRLTGYRLVNWWPRRLGGTISYISFWLGALITGAVIYYYDIFGVQKHRRQRTGKTHAGDPVDWERKTFWVTLAFATMGMPALV
jgi:hypothetical protein